MLMLIDAATLCLRHIEYILLRHMLPRCRAIAAHCSTPPCRFSLIRIEPNELICRRYRHERKARAYICLLLIFFAP